MGTTIAGNTHAGTVYKERQYVWAKGLGGDYKEVELFEEDGFIVYQFNPLYDQRNDGVLAVEFYYYYHKPDTQAFWDYVYYPDNYYIVPFLAWYDDDPKKNGKFGGLITDAPKISLVGRESGWIHVTLYVDEYIWGRFTEDGKTYDNSIYLGIYSPLLNFCYDTSVTDIGPVVPYQLEFDYEDEEDYEVYEFLIGGYMEDFYWRRIPKNFYPSFYITYRDVTPESFTYSVNETAVMNVSSSLAKKANFKKLLSEIKAVCATDTRKLIATRNGGRDSFFISATTSRKERFNRSFSESNNASSMQNRKQGLFKSIAETSDIVSLENRKLGIKLLPFSENLIPVSIASRMLGIKKTCASVARNTSSFLRRLWYVRNNLTDNPHSVSSIFRRNHLKSKASSSLVFNDEHKNQMFFKRLGGSEYQIIDSSERKADWKRRLEFSPDMETEVTRKQVLFRFEESESDFTARPFASRLFFRTVQSVASFWDWLRGKIREANNVVTLYCPITFEITLESKI